MITGTLIVYEGGNAYTKMKLVLHTQTVEGLVSIILETRHTQ